MERGRGEIGVAVAVQVSRRHLPGVMRGVERGMARQGAGAVVQEDRHAQGVELCDGDIQIAVAVEIRQGRSRRPYL